MAYLHSAFQDGGCLQCCDCPPSRLAIGYTGRSPRWSCPFVVRSLREIRGNSDGCIVLVHLIGQEVPHSLVQAFPGRFQGAYFGVNCVYFSGCLACVNAVSLIQILFDCTELFGVHDGFDQHVGECLCF